MGKEWRKIWKEVSFIAKLGAGCAVVATPSYLRRRQHDKMERSSGMLERCDTVYASLACNAPAAHAMHELEASAALSVPRLSHVPDPGM